MTPARYEVESELNPRYAETGDQADYYGVYHVVKYEADTREIIETYPAGYANARFVTYRHAARLNAARDPHDDD
jgi:hypothetical protein